MIISKEYLEALKDYTHDAQQAILDDIADDKTNFDDDQDFAILLTEELALMTKLFHSINFDENLELTDEEADLLKFTIECYIFSIIRNDDDIDNPEWLYNIMAVWKIIQK